MRRLRKSDPPPVIDRSGAKWTAQYLASPTTRPWAAKSIKSALVTETSGKCAYCEAKVLNVTYGDIEHIKPKSRFPELVVEWRNLTLVCPRCNQEKGDKYAADLEFVNPYEDEPDDHLLFLGPIVIGVSDRGDYTVEELGLNDAPRFEARQRVIREIENTFRLIELARGTARERLESLIDLHLESGDYTAAVRAFVSLRQARIQAT